MRWIGICERAFDEMCRRAVRRDLAPGEPLASRQLVQAWVAESRAEIDASRLLVLHAAWRIDQAGAAAARDDISLIKFHAAGTLQRVLDRAIQTCGAAGLVDDTPLAFWWRHERGARIYDGPDEVHKTAVARRILERYARAAAAETARTPQTAETTRTTPRTEAAPSPPAPEAARISAAPETPETTGR
jgi:alkylation response protein AidB-like acyl-CoA dehydrogenase